MSRYPIVVIWALLVFALVAGCADKEDEVAELEQEMRDQQATVADSVADSAAIDSSALWAADSLDAAAVPQETEAPEMPAKPAGEGFTVQVAGCESRDYADHLIELYRGRGYEPYMTVETVDGQVYYRVRIGVYGSFQEAKALVAELEDRYSVTAWIDHATE